MGSRDPRIDAYIAKAAPFARPILERLRKVVHAGCPDVEETIKWSMPAFHFRGPLAHMAAFKAHAVFGLWKGELLGKGGRLGKSDESAMGQFGRLTSLDDLPSERTLVALVRRAVALNEAGRTVKRVPKVKAALKEPADFMAALRRSPRALATYRDFSPSHKREYVEWVTGAKTDATRERRLATAVEWMAEGKIRNWKYVRR